MHVHNSQPKADFSPKMDSKGQLISKGFLFFSIQKMNDKFLSQ